jgi:lipopolysaccharide export system permease protein
MNQQKLNAAWWSIGSFYVFDAVFAPIRNTFLYVILILECVRLKIIWSIAIHQPHPAITVFKYLVQWLPLYVGMAMQISLAVGIMMGLAKICRSRELDALYALGFSLHQLLAPVLILTLAIVVTSFVIFGWLQPLSIYYSKLFIHDIEQSSALISDGNDVFRVDGAKTVMLDGISRDGKKFDRVFIYENFPDGKAVTTAGSSGHLVGEGSLSSQHYYVDTLDVMEVKDSAGARSVHTSTVTQSANVQGPLNSVGVESFRQRGASEYEWTLDELMTGGPNISNYVNPLRTQAEINYRFAQMLFIILLPFIAAASIIEPRRNPGPLRFLIGLLIVLGFNQYLGLATSFSRNNFLSPIVALWLPLGLLTMAVMYRFWKIGYRPAFQTAR